MKTIAGALFVLAAAVLFVGGGVCESMPRVGGGWRPEAVYVLAYLAAFGFLIFGGVIFIVGMTSETWPRSNTRWEPRYEPRRYRDSDSDYPPRRDVRREDDDY
jgi:hypothetical protein